MDRTCRNFSTAVLLILLIPMFGCANKSDLERHHTSTNSEKSIEVKTKNGIVEITPTVVSYTPEQFGDPLESINRAIFSFNHVVYTWALNPLAKSYTYIMPDPVETGVSHFFSNLREPLNAINHLLQAQGSKMGNNLGRFLINTTVGILGFFDPADAWFDIKPQKSTLNDTLTTWNVGYGAFIVIPILGQSDIRNGLSSFTETTFAPITYVTESPQTLYIQVYDGFHEFSPKAASYETLYKESDDPYVFFRNMYMQSVLRDKEFQAVEENVETDVTSNKKGQTDE